MEKKCRICGNIEENKSMTVREMWFGTREEFEYFQCAACGCLQIAEIPEDMSRHYPKDQYYSYNMQVKTGKLRDWLHKSLFWGYKLKMLPARFRYLRAFSALSIIKKWKHNLSILDVGCGDGRLVQEMGIWGWKNLTGIDPFIEKDVFYPSGVRVLKQNIFQHEGTYDFIMMHHSFEHMDAPLEALQQCYKLLAPDGQLLIRIPVADCYVMRKYGANSFQIDAPRHFFLHTTRSLAILAKKSNFIIDKIEYDSNNHQFFYSENYCLDLPYCSAMKNSIIPRKRMKTLKKQAKILNAIHDGDLACFILKKR